MHALHTLLLLLLQQRQPASCTQPSFCVVLVQMCVHGQCSSTGALLLVILRAALNCSRRCPDLCVLTGAVVLSSGQASLGSYAHNSGTASGGSCHLIITKTVTLEGLALRLAKRLQIDTASTSARVAP